MTARRAYLDYNASAPLLPDARAAVIAALDADGNASSVHGAGRLQKTLLQGARRKVAALVNAAPDHVIFTSGATEAAALVLTPHYSMGRAALAVRHLFVAASDHPCVLGGGRFAPGDVTQLAVGADGRLDPATVDAALAAKGGMGPVILAVHLANNETGVIQPVTQLAEVARRHGAIFVVDAVQAVGRVPLDIQTLGADFLIVSAHKIGGPKGAGALIARSDLMMPMPLLSGGGQERGHRAGTENIAAIAGFGAAADATLAGISGFAALADLRDRFERTLRAAIPDLVIHGEKAARLANTSFFTVPGVKAEILQIRLDLAGFAVSSGSACSSGKVGRSHVLSAMGVTAEDGAIRVSFGPDTQPETLDQLAAAVIEAAGRMRLGSA